MRPLLCCPSLPRSYTPLALLHSIGGSRLYLLDQLLTHASTLPFTHSYTYNTTGFHHHCSLYSRHLAPVFHRRGWKPGESLLSPFWWQQAIVAHSNIKGFWFFKGGQTVGGELLLQPLRRGWLWSNGVGERLLRHYRYRSFRCYGNRCIQSVCLLSFCMLVSLRCWNMSGDACVWFW